MMSRTHQADRCLEALTPGFPHITQTLGVVDVVRQSHLTLNQCAIREGLHTTHIVRLLNGRTISHRIGERYAEFNDVRAACFHGKQGWNGILRRGIACSDKSYERGLPLSRPQMRAYIDRIQVVPPALYERRLV